MNNSGASTLAVTGAYGTAYASGVDSLVLVTNTNNNTADTFNFKLNTTTNTGFTGTLIRTDAVSSWAATGNITYTVLPVSTIVTAGILVLNNASAIAANTGIKVSSGGTLDLNGNNLVSTISIGLNGGTLTNAGSSTSTINGNIIVIAASTINGTKDISVSGFVNNP